MPSIRNFFIIVVLTALLQGVALADIVTDRSGRRIRVDRPFQRIISLYGAHTENLFRLGLNDEIIGVGRNEAFPPEALEKPSFSYHDDAEKFMALRPDLVLVRPMIDRVYQPFVRKLELAGITVVSLQPVGIEDMYRYWRDLGILTGKKAEAEAMARSFEAGLTAIREQVETIPREARKKVYFEAIHRKMKTFSRDSMAMFVLRTAGGINVAEDASQMRQTNIAAYGKERILAKAAIIDVYLAQQGAMNPITKADILNEPGFQAIKAVQYGKVYLIDEWIVSRPTFRLIEGITRVVRILYPDLMQSPACP